MIHILKCTINILEDTNMQMGQRNCVQLAFNLTYKLNFIVRKDAVSNRIVAVPMYNKETT